MPPRTSPSQPPAMPVKNGHWGGQEMLDNGWVHFKDSSLRVDLPAETLNAVWWSVTAKAKTSKFHDHWENHSMARLDVASLIRNTNIESTSFLIASKPTHLSVQKHRQSPRVYQNVINSLHHLGPRNWSSLTSNHCHYSCPHVTSDLAGLLLGPWSQMFNQWIFHHLGIFNLAGFLPTSTCWSQTTETSKASKPRGKIIPTNNFIGLSEIKPRGGQPPLLPRNMLSDPRSQCLDAQMVLRGSTHGGSCTHLYPPNDLTALTVFENFL